MGVLYLETSALVKLYVREAGSDWLLKAAARSSRNRLAVLDLSRIECRAAIRRRQRAGEISATAADTILSRLDTQMQSRFVVQPLSEAVLQTAERLLDLHDLRAYDSLQLAGCLVLRASSGTPPPVFVCADQKLTAAARLEGFEVQALG